MGLLWTIKKFTTIIFAVTVLYDLLKRCFPIQGLGFFFYAYISITPMKFLGITLPIRKTMTV